MGTTHIRKHLALSITHIKEHDIDILNTHGFTPTCAPYPYGVVVFVSACECDREEQEAYILNLQEVGFSEAFCNVYRLAWEHDVDLILLDSDEEVIEVLPTFE